MNPSMDYNVAPREGEDDVARIGGVGVFASSAAAATSPTYRSPSYPSYSGRPIIMIGDIAKDLSNLCLRPPSPVPPPTTTTRTTATAAAAAALKDELAADYEDEEVDGEDAEVECGWSPRRRYYGSKQPATATVEQHHHQQQQLQHQNFRYPGSDDFSQNSMSDVSVDEIFNEVPHILETYGRAAAALAATAAAAESSSTSMMYWSSPKSPSRRVALVDGPVRSIGGNGAALLSTPQPPSSPRRKSSSIDIDRVDDWIVEPVDMAVKAGCGSLAPPPASPLPNVLFTETTVDETTEASLAHSQAPSFYDDDAAPAPTPLSSSGRRRPVVPRFPSEEILYQSEKQPPPPPPPPVDFTSAYEALAIAGGLCHSNNINNDYSSSTHLQRSAVSHPSTLSSTSDWVALGNAHSADGYSPSPSRSRHRSNSGMDNEYYHSRNPSSFEPWDEPQHLPPGVGGPYGPLTTRHDARGGIESRRHPTPDHDYRQHGAYGHEELLLLQQSYSPPPPPPRPSSSNLRLPIQDDRGYGVPVHEHVSSTILGRSPPSPPPPAPPLPQHRAPARVPSPPPSLLPSPPPKDEVVIEVSPGEFLPLRGSHETLQAIEQGLGQQVTCMACGAMLTCIHDCLMVICPDCRCVSQTPNENDHSTVWVRMEDGEPSSSISHADGIGNGSSHNNSNSSSSRHHSSLSGHGGGGGGGGADWWERGVEEEESESSFLGGFAARHRQEATRRRANVMAISTRPKHGVGLGLKVADH